jgi:hypothetical protein
MRPGLNVPPIGTCNLLNAGFWVGPEGSKPIVGLPIGTVFLLVAKQLDQQESVWAFCNCYLSAEHAIQDHVAKGPSHPCNPCSS